MTVNRIEIHPAEAQRRIARMVRELEEPIAADGGAPGDVESYWDKAALEFAYETIKEVRKMYAESSL